MQRLLAAGYSPHHRFSGEIDQHGFLTHYTRNVLHLVAVAPEAGALRVLLQAICPTNTQIVDMMVDSPAIQQAIHMHPRTEKGETPLHWAVRDGSVEAITLLRQAMARPETTCLARCKPADLATGSDREQRLRALQGR